MLTFAEARALRAEAGRVTGNVIAPLGFGAKIDLLSYLLALSFSVQGAYPGTAEYDFAPGGISCPVHGENHGHGQSRTCEEYASAA